MSVEPDGVFTSAVTHALLAGLTGDRGALILTTSPTVWARAVTDTPHSVADVSGLLGIMAGWTSGGVTIDDYVLQELLSAGWPREAIFREYRSDLRSRAVADFVLLNDEGKVHVVLETARYSASDSREESRLAQLQASFNAPFGSLVTPAKTILRTGDGSIVSLDGVVKPTDVGVTPAAPASRRPHRVTSRAELKSLVDAAGPCVVIDFTMPFFTNTSALSPEVKSMASSAEVAIDSAGSIAGTLLAWLVASNLTSEMRAVLPVDALRSERLAPWRELIATTAPPVAFVELPRDAFDYHRVQLSLAFFSGGANRTFFDAIPGRDALIGHVDKEWYRSLELHLRGGEPTTGYVRTTGSLQDWSFASNHPDIGQTTVRLQRFGASRPLGELCTLRRGRLSIRDTNATPAVPVRLITPKALRSGPDEESAPTYVEQSHIRPTELLEIGDVLLSQTAGAHGVATVFASQDPAVAASGVLVLRPTPDLITSTYLAEYLNSTTARRLIDAQATSGLVIRRIDPRALSRILVPLTADALPLEQLAQVGQTERRLRAQADDLASRRASLFDANGPGELKSSLRALVRTGELLAASVEAAHNPMFQITNFYPFPIAYGYRLLQGRADTSDLIPEQLRVGENILAYLGCLSLSAIQVADRAQLGFDAREMWGNGISPGHWKTIVTKASEILATYQRHALAQAITDLRFARENKGIGKVVSEFVPLINDAKHHRLDEARLETVPRELQTLLDDMMGKLAFATEFPIRLVKAVRTNRDGSFQVLCQSYVGDHPGLQTETLDMQTTPPATDDLFLNLGEEQRISLFPFISVARCPKCGIRETYFPDKILTRGGQKLAMLKSFERGHTIESLEVATHLVSWFGPNAQSSV